MRPGPFGLADGLKSTFTNGTTACHADRDMWKKSILLVPVLALLAGCATTATNISARKQPRNPENMYPVEVKMDSRQQALKWDTIEVTVFVGKESYPMRRTHMMRNRWEAMIPVPAGVSAVDYHYRFEYLVNEFGAPKKDTFSSKTYTLQILD
jgi:hypothetical protein